MAPLLPLLATAPGLPLLSASFSLGRKRSGLGLGNQPLLRDRDALFDDGTNFLRFLQSGDDSTGNLGGVCIEIRRFPFRQKDGGCQIPEQGFTVRRIAS